MKFIQQWFHTFQLKCVSGPRYIQTLKGGVKGDQRWDLQTLLARFHISRACMIEHHGSFASISFTFPLTYTHKYIPDTVDRREKNVPLGKMLLWCNQQQCSKTNLVNKKIILVEGSESCLVGLIKYKVLLSTCNLVLGSRCYLGYVSCRKPPYVTWWSQNHVI